MSGCRALARLRTPETGESCSFGVLFGRNKNTTMAEEKVRSLRSAETESSKSPETIACGSSWLWRLGRAGRSGPEWAGSDRETKNQRKSWQKRGKEWLCSVYSVKTEGVTGSRPGPRGGCLGASSKAGRGGGVTQDVGGGSLRAQSPTAREKKLEKVVWSQWRKHSEIAHYSWWEYYSDSAAWIYLVNFKRKLCNISFKLDLVFRVIVGSS